MNAQLQENMEFEIEDLKMRINSIKDELEEGVEKIDYTYLIFLLGHVSELAGNIYTLFQDIRSEENA